MVLYDDDVCCGSHGSGKRGCERGQSGHSYYSATKPSIAFQISFFHFKMDFLFLEFHE